MILNQYNYLQNCSILLAYTTIVMLNQNILTNLKLKRSSYYLPASLSGSLPFKNYKITHLIIPFFPCYKYIN